MDSKEIIIVHKTCVADFPPLLSFLRYLKRNGYIVRMILGYEKDRGLAEELRGLCETLHITNILPSSNKVFYWLKVRRQFWKIIYENKYEDKLIWLPAADTTLALGTKLLRYNYVLNLYELFDNEPLYLKRLKKFAQNAKLVICSNLERSNILRVWYQLDTTPSVILNKPNADISGRNLPLPPDIEKKIEALSKTKIIIYQGMISKERELEGLCTILKDRPDFSLIIMGSDTAYLKELMCINPNIVHIPFVAPPYHLHVTSHAHIGVLSYDHSSLNNIFCAPNKLWEFSNFQLPMLGNNIPGLYTTIEANKMGKCADFSNLRSIERSLQDIVDQYEHYSENARLYYDSYDYDEEISKIMNIIKI